MNGFIHNSVFLGVTISFAAYGVGMFLRKKINSPLCNPLIISIIITVAVVLIAGIDYEVYESGTKYIQFLLTPATVSLAVPMYEQIEALKNNWKAVIAGITSGVAASFVSVLGLSVLFGLSHKEYVSFLPKSITSAIGMVLSEELGGHVSITIMAIVITGVLGSVVAETVLKIFKITHPVAKGIAIGTSSHAAGTSKAAELGETECAMSGLSIVIAGIITVIFASFFAGLY